MTIQYRPARRSNAKPIIGIQSESGAGKTFSALLLARGFCGPQRRVCMIETEAGRGEAFADDPRLSLGDEPPFYDVVSIRDDFSPQEYHAAIKLAEKHNP